MLIRSVISLPSALLLYRGKLQHIDPLGDFPSDCGLV